MTQTEAYLIRALRQVRHDIAESKTTPYRRKILLGRAETNLAIAGYYLAKLDLED